MTIHWKAVERYFTVFLFQFYRTLVILEDSSVLKGLTITLSSFVFKKEANNCTDC